MKRSTRKTREDCRQNREEILKAARHTIQKLGVNVAFETIAKKAGVGRATIYRNFTDRHSLLIAIYELSLYELEKEAQRIGAHDNAFFILFRYLCKMGVENRYLGYLIRSADFPTQERDRLLEWFIRIFGPPVEYSKAAGLLRSDFSASKVLLVTNMLAGAIDGIKPGDKASFNWAYSLLTSYLKAKAK